MNFSSIMIIFSSKISYIPAKSSKFAALFLWDEY